MLEEDFATVVKVSAANENRRREFRHLCKYYRVPDYQARRRPLVTAKLRPALQASVEEQAVASGESRRGAPADLAKGHALIGEDPSSSVGVS